MIKRLMIVLCVLIPVIAYNADGENESRIMFRFEDKPGTYLIKLEPVKSFVQKSKTEFNYDVIKTAQFNYKQVDVHGSFTEYVYLPKETEKLRISVRKSKNGTFGRGGYVFIDAIELFKGALVYQDAKRYSFGILMANQFENLAVTKGNKTKPYTLGIDSDYWY